MTVRSRSVPSIDQQLQMGAAYDSWDAHDRDDGEGETTPRKQAHELASRAAEVEGGVGNTTTALAL